MVAVLDAEHETVDAAALAALQAAEAVFAKRAQYVVVGQRKASKERVTIPSNDPDAIKVSLGWYSTEGDALAAAKSLWWSTATGDNYWTWVLPVHHGTPAELHSKQAEKYKQAAEKRKEKAREKLAESIKARQEAAAVRAAGGKGACECRHQAADHLKDVCVMTGCYCTSWRERKN